MFLVVAIQIPRSCRLGYLASTGHARRGGDLARRAAWVPGGAAAAAPTGSALGPKV